MLGPTAGAILGDLGAHVIKVEPPVTGEPGREIEKYSSAASRIRGGGAQFEVFNRNKRSITLDLTNERGRGVFYRLVSITDVVLNNWRKGVAEKLKVDYETLAGYNPKVIYAHAGGWGSKGLESDDPAMDFAAIARSGMAYQAGGPDDPPAIFVSGYADMVAGTLLAQGILAALVARERKQVGQKIEVSLLGSMVAGLERLPVNITARTGEEMPGRNRTEMGNALWNYYKGSIGKWIALAMLAADNYWPSFCKALGIPELEHDPKFRDIGVRSQLENSKALILILDQIFAKKPQKEWLGILREYGLVCAPIQTISELLSDPQVLENEYIIDYDHPVYGPIKTVGFPWNFSKTPAELQLPAP